MEITAKSSRSSRGQLTLATLMLTILVCIIALAFYPAAAHASAPYDLDYDSSNIPVDQTTHKATFKSDNVKFTVKAADDAEFIHVIELRNGDNESLKETPLYKYVVLELKPIDDDAYMIVGSYVATKTGAKSMELPLSGTQMRDPEERNSFSMMCVAPYLFNLAIWGDINEELLHSSAYGANRAKASVLFDTKSKKAIDGQGLEWSAIDRETNLPSVSIKEYAPEKKINAKYLAGSMFHDETSVKIISRDLSKTLGTIAVPKNCFYSAQALAGGKGFEISLGYGHSPRYYNMKLKVIKVQNSFMIWPGHGLKQTGFGKSKTMNLEFVASDLKKSKDICFSLEARTPMTPKITYLTPKAKKYIEIKKNTVYVKKGTPKGTYKVKVKFTAKGTAFYKSRTFTRTLIVNVRDKITPVLQFNYNQNIKLTKKEAASLKKEAYTNEGYVGSYVNGSLGGERSAIKFKVVKYLGNAKKYVSIKDMNMWTSSGNMFQIKLKKGTPSGTYKFKVNAYRPATKHNNAVSKDYMVTVRVP